ncbi:aminopeptidase [uncultured Cyclobacterium sp.]|uniref:aminopeptidase n=1 Tax=uncultured Cyclobacterium sp. TaxID=453820 RepID=UPI0030ECFE74|tara:strand:+ start:177677 stop:178594 length:918 start_codon:yes stop_codon:yes gene_type:complete
MPFTKLLKEILHLDSVSGDESRISAFILQYILEKKSTWKVTPEIHCGEGFHDNIILVFGKPRTAVFAHMDTVGFTARYENQLVPIGGPELLDGVWLSGRDEAGPIRCMAKEINGNVFHDFPRKIQTGTLLSFEQDITIENGWLQAAHLDNRIGIYTLLGICETLEDGILVFSTYEEHGGGSVPFLIRFIYENWQVKNALIADVTWVTEGVHFDKGAVISMRDSFIPRKTFVNKIIAFARDSGIPFQLEVESYGGSDGREIQLSPYAIDWCFIGIPQENPHTPIEKVAISDMESMFKLYQYLLRYL